MPCTKRGFTSIYRQEIVCIDPREGKNAQQQQQQLLKRLGKVKLKIEKSDKKSTNPE